MQILRRITPAARLSAGLVFITITALLLAETAGFVPDRLSLVAQGRIQLSEALAIELSGAAQRADITGALRAAADAVGRHADLRSIGMRLHDGTIVFTTPRHDEHWQELKDGQSTATHIQLPLEKNNRAWGRVEFSFAQLDGAGLFGPGLRLALFVSLIGWIMYWIYLRRALKYLDPAAVVPDRIRTVLDTMSEGVLVLDKSEDVVLANASFQRFINCKESELLGKRASAFEWQQSPSTTTTGELPWVAAAKTGSASRGTVLSLLDEAGSRRLLSVNAAPIQGVGGAARGLLATFDDVTEIEEKNHELEKMLRRLEQARSEVSRQNDELSEQKVALEKEITERVAAQNESERLHRELERTAHSAGMAEVASSVLHNVGNVLAATNTSAQIIEEKLRGSRVSNLAKATDLMKEHSDALGEFISSDPRGKLLPGYLADLALNLNDEQKSLFEETNNLLDGINHIKEIVRTQQDLAKMEQRFDEAELEGVLHDALSLLKPDIDPHGIEIEWDVEPLPAMLTNRHKVLQIVVNLIRNAAQALVEAGTNDPRITIALHRAPNDMVSIEVRDNGPGFTPEVHEKLFTLGFTTKKKGHGLGLHAAAVAGQELGGGIAARSDGPGTGATFRLEIPFDSNQGV